MISVNMVDALILKAVHQQTVINACLEIYRDICGRYRGKQHFEQPGNSTSEGDELHYLRFSVPNRNQSLALPRQLTTGVQSPHKHKHTHKFKHSVFRHSNSQRHIYKKKNALVNIPMCLCVCLCVCKCVMFNSWAIMLKTQQWLRIKCKHNVIICPYRFT